MIDWTKSIETVPCERNPKPVPCTFIYPDRVRINGGWIDFDGDDEKGNDWDCSVDGRFLLLNGSIRNVQQDQQPELDSTATWWAKRWWQSATDAEKDAMRVLAGSE